MVGQVKEVLNSVFGDLMKKHRLLDLQKTQKVWRGIVGPKACAHTKIVYLTKDKIRVNVDSSAWLYELNLKKEGIQKSLDRALKIKDIKFKLGGIK